MPRNTKFPPSPEIKRAIAAASSAGIEIGSVDIHPNKITIHRRDPSDKNAPDLSEYDLWTMSLGQNTENIRHVEEKSDALPKKTKR